MLITNTKFKINTLTESFFVLLKGILFILASIIIWYTILTPRIVSSSVEMTNDLRFVEIYNIDATGIIELSNIARLNNNLGLLKENNELKKIAKNRFNDMVEYNYFNHQSPEGEKNFKHFLMQSNYKYMIAGENLAIDFKDNNKMFDAWMNSKTHRLNILNPAFNEIGVYQKETTFNGRQTLISVMVLGRHL